MRRYVARLVAAVALTAAASALPVAPAQAAACSSADGVTVVVDFHELGGGVRQVCDAGGAGKYAAAQFADAGFTLTRVSRQPGFVCRVEGKPAADPCVNTPPADAYWGLWWSDGESGSWSYSSQGVDSLKVPEGGSVALSWNGSSTKSPPGAAPPTHASSSPSPSPTPSPTPKPTKGASPQPGGQPGGQPGPTAGGGPGPSGSATTGTTGSSSGSATPSASPSAKRTPDKAGTGKGAQGKQGRDSRERDSESDASGTPSPDATASSSPSPVAAPTSEPPTTGGGGMPVWVAPAAIGLLFAGAAGTAVVRRRKGAAGA